MVDTPRENLTRAIPFQIERAEPVGDGFTLSGYAAPFGSPTRIDSWEGKFDEQIAPGAFRKTLREKTPILMFEHGRGHTGTLPIGSFTVLKEDERGLYVEARLFQNDLVLPIQQAIAARAIDGMSIRFSVVREKWDKTGEIPMRMLQEVRLAELGPVVFPAYSDTSVGVRSLDPGQQALICEILADDTMRSHVARALVLGTTPAPPSDEGTRDDEAPIEDAARAEGTSDDAPPQGQEPPQEGTPAPSSKRDRQRLVAQLKGITHESTGGSPSASDGSE